jgi:hypothetical protein
MANTSERCECCGDTATTRRAILIVGGRAYTDTPVCATCATCEECEAVIHTHLVEDEHGSFVVETCECVEARVTRV